jgi:putative peptide zinc metalloprotease protein
MLLGVNDPWPEQLPGNTNRYLIAFAVFTWVYRLVVFLGIALLVYHFFFKLLGIILLILELAVFIVRPIWAELKLWHARRADVPARRKRLAWMSGAGLLLILLIPWQTGVSGAGWVHSAQQQAIYSPLAGRMLTLPGKQPVAQGQTLFVLESPDLRIAAARADEQAQARARELVGLAGLPEGESRRANLQFQQQQYQAEAAMYQQEQSRLQLSAPFAGVLYDLDPLLAPGVWVQPRQPLAMLIDPAHWVADIYINESDIGRVRVGDTARVQMGNAAPYFMRGRVIEVDASRTVSLPSAMLDAKAGGPIATQPGAPGESTPSAVLYRVKIQLEGKPQAPQAVICKAVISGAPRAFLASLFERSTAVLIRESGF